ncbi:hypothetical protein [Paenibacillus sp. OV219]|uniref:hypothetical protein n=1 Tax=Paenibacillus sp. OV219 TaxID=1884377 RepID=UPI0008B39324|nr:hypothetical protein [Paenibacillus sp. OV219]SEM72403.1 hypothetical protein SAMN05518847_101620 [Paenibacillus sp. OV219]
MAFRKLFVKEWRSALPLYGVFSALVLALQLLVLYKSSGWDDADIWLLSFFLPIIGAGLITIGTSYYQLHMEWRTNSVYLLLSLPVRGWKVLTAKAAAVISLQLLSCLWIAVSFTLVIGLANWNDWVLGSDLEAHYPWMINLVANSCWLYFLITALLLVVVQFAYLSGQLVFKFKWLVVGSACLAAIWLLLRISPLISDLLNWLPEIVVRGGEKDIVYLHSGPFIGLLFLCAGLMWLNGYIFEKEVEV